MDAHLLCTPCFYFKSLSCGYCHLENKEKKILPNCTLGFDTYRMTPQIYERIMNKGYRRSGSFVYRMDALRNCCQLFTIRTRYMDPDSGECFKPSKELKRCVNKVANKLGCKLPNKKNTFDLLNSIEFIHSFDKGKFHTEFDDGKLTREKFELYKKYQVQVHGDKPEEVTESSFSRFLCKSSFTPSDGLADLEKWTAGVESPRYLGLVHQKYYIGDTLVAIAVLDVLPNSLSSVYFVWDPEYASLSLGNFSALTEMILAHKLNKAHYYMGYYICGNPKMRYKKKFGGELLDFGTEKYVDLQYLEGNGLVNDNEPLILKDINDNNNTNSKEYPETLKITPDVKLVNISRDLYSPKSAYWEKQSENLKKINQELGVEFETDIEAIEGLTVYNCDPSGDGIHKVNDRPLEADRIPIFIPGLKETDDILMNLNAGKLYNHVTSCAVIGDVDLDYENMQMTSIIYYKMLGNMIDKLSVLYA